MCKYRLTKKFTVYNSYKYTSMWTQSDQACRFELCMNLKCEYFNSLYLSLGFFVGRGGGVLLLSNMLTWTCSVV